MSCIRFVASFRVLELTHASPNAVPAAAGGGVTFSAGTTITLPVAVVTSALSLISTAASAANLSASGVTACASATAALVSNATSLPLSDAQKALTVLVTVANSTLITGSSANAVAAALSSIVAAPSATNVSSIGKTAGAAVASMATGLATSGGNCSSSSTPATVLVSSSAINMLVTTCASGANATTSLTLSSGIGFANAPASVTSSTTPVHSIMYTLAFDPHSGLANTTGVLSMQYIDGTSNNPLSIGNLSSLLYFNLPAMYLPGGSSALATFWDPDATPPAYSTVGVVAMPNPSPAGLTLDWDPTFDASQQPLAFSWTLSGPAVANCYQTVLNCSDSTLDGQLFSQDPVNGLGNNTVACPTGTTTPRRTIYGANCTLWQTNATGCYWSNTAQAFAGSGCITANTTRMATRHLTEFLGSPQIAVASQSDLTLTLEDFKHIRFLVMVVGCLFGGMLFGSALLSFRDGHDRKHLVQMTFSDKLGFATTTGGLWTWRLHQNPLPGVSGPAVELAALLGIPFARLACAIPEEMLGVNAVGEAVGRVGGMSRVALSPAAAAAGAAKIKDSSPQLPAAVDGGEAAAATTGDDDDFSASAHAFGADGLPQLSSDVAAALKQALAALGPPTLNEMASTALMHAFMSTYCFGDAETVASQQHAYAQRLDAAGLSSARFFHMYRVFKELLIAGVLRSSAAWWHIARVFRAVLLSNPEGYWDADGGVALSLLATTYTQPKVDLGGIAHVIAAVQTAMSMFASGAISGTDGAMHEAGTRYQAKHVTKKMPDLRLSGSVPPPPAGAEDCPLSYSADALRDSIPAELLDAGLQGDELRVWTTACCVALLENLPSAWYSQPEEESLSEAGQEWLQSKLTAKPELLAQLHIHASDTVARWAMNHDAMVTASRAGHITSLEHGAAVLRRAVGRICNSMVTQHPTLGIFTSEALVGSKRWQSFLLVVTALMAVFTTSIMLYFSRSAVCARAVRLELGCTPNFRDACHGFTGKYIDLEATLYRLAAPALQGESTARPPPICTAFPMPDKASHTFASGLISAFAAWLVTAFASVCFSLHHSTDDEQLHGRAHLKRWPLMYRLLFGRAPWRRASAAALRWHKLKLAGSWVRSWLTIVLVSCASAVDTEPVREPEDAPPASEKEALDAARSFKRVTKAYNAVGLAALAACWGLMLFLVFVYGALVYDLLGEAAEKAFVTSWGVGVGVGQVQDFRSLLISAAEAVLALTLLELAWIQSNPSWFESNVDFLSVLNTVPAAAAAAGSSWRHARFGVSTRAYLRFYKGVSG